jgi:tetratricopeptide (TPR) repeat protein
MMAWRQRLAEARSAWEAGDGDRALALARAARAAAPAEPAAAFLLCMVLLHRRDPEATTLLGALERFADYAPGWEELGQTLAARHPAAAAVAWHRAAQGYAAAEAATPTAAAAFRLARVLRQLDDRAAARDALQRATLRDPSLAEAWFALGLVFQDLGDAAAAIRAFAASLSTQPDFHEAAFNLGVAHQEAGDLEAALDAYAHAWRLRPGSFGRIAQALVSPAVGRLWLHPSALERELAARA